ncbi:MAG: aminoglycoside phosphotransferase (APT) family kinase protein [Candidatus Aldehydirespiratoraceae bacterium]|jgi:aminoglycoside phosphotransferase (APT) family kinase protein
MADSSDLASLLSDALGGAEVDSLTRLTGGASRETWRFTADGAARIVQRQRAGDERDMMIEAGVVAAAGAANVPVPELIAAERGGDGSAFMILEAIEGETIARKLQRDDEFAEARSLLTGQLGAALARVHSMEPATATGLERVDQMDFYTNVLDSLGHAYPMLELVRKWLLENQPPASAEVVVHGDFRLGNMIVGSNGLRAVIDWELAHLGDAMEDLGWLCVKAWRFGQAPPVAGLGQYGELFAAYESAGGRKVDANVVRWWEVLGTWKWAIMCILQANVHLSGAARSHELAAVGRRVCENEHDLFLALEGRW